MDEYKIKINSIARKYVRKPVAERNNAKYTSNMAIFDVENVMICGCFKCDGKRKLVKVDENLNSENYISFLSFNLLPDYKVGDIFFRMTVLLATHKNFLWMKMLNFWKTGQHKFPIAMELDHFSGN